MKASLVLDDSHKKKRILLTGARAPVTLDLARQFHAAGHMVYLADSIYWPIAKLTRAARRTFHVASPADHPERFVEDLLQIAKKYRIDLVIPTCEEIFYLAAHRSRWDSVCEVFADTFSQLEALHDKGRFSQAVVALKGSAMSPESHRLSHPDAMQPWLERFDLTDWVFKPVFSRFASRTMIGPTAQTLRTLSPSSTDPWLVQRRVRGEEYSTYSVARSGNLRAHACYRSKYRAGPGSGIYFLPVEDDRIRRFVDAFVREHDYTGQIGFDFMVDRENNLFVLECNPRATSGLHLLQDVPLANAFLQAEGSLLESRSQSPAMLASVMMLYAFPEAIGQGGMVKLGRDMCRARDVLFAWRDPLPALLAPIALIEVALRSLTTGKKLTQAATFDIEWNGEPM